MANIGFDWGTTTTSVCFFKKEKNTYDYLRFGGNQLDVFPTVIAYRKLKNQEEKRQIGFAAKNLSCHPKYDVYSNFKLELNENATDSGERNKSAYEVTQDFIGMTIGEYHYIHSALPQGIVFTVPDSWGKDIFRHSSLMILEQIIRDIMGPKFDVENQISFCSEPVAAAFYCKEVCRDQFRGSLLIVDLGGGTIDLTLCEVKNSDNIVVVKRCGETGETPSGCSGEAFDLEMTKKISEDNELESEPGSKEFFMLKNCFEDAKISNAAVTDNLLRQYYAAVETEKKVLGKNTVFDVTDSNYEEYPVSVEDIVNTFDRVNRKPLENRLKEILSYCAEENILTTDKNFRVILTGGFSNLYCVEATVREILGAPVTGKDMRFDFGINRTSRSTAIAHGAAIIADGVIKIDELFQKNVGFSYFDVFSNQRQKVTLLKTKALVKNLREPIYFERFFAAENLREDSSLTVFVEDGYEKFSLEVALNKICSAKKDKKYIFGLSLGRRQNIFFHALDSDGADRKIPVGFS